MDATTPPPAPHAPDPVADPVAASGARVLVVQHQLDCPPALFADWLAAAGCTLDVWSAGSGEPVPTDLGDHDGLLVLGGSPGANDDEVAPWLPGVRALVRTAAAAGVPTLGICLGHQLAAVALGGEIHRNPNGQQLGLTPIGWTDEAAADPLVGPLVAAGGPVPGAPARGVHWNNDVVTTLPAGATRLATAPGGEVQAARHAPSVWGVQLHPEADRAIVEPWAAADADEHAARGTDQAAVLDAVEAARPELVATWEPLAASYARLVRERVLARVGG
ncbi:type 1 glutamine amidotransferase [Nocardioides alkalitolerans]|uniref:type 1 glutamine amidotransferase n=1 Tax=Nocardioides alkalitolerans TaxID=281714 RepID=UPI0003F5717A|nr:type 1 glutamine amidotransferase [Nocardioides alkalitolerans]